MKRFVLSSDASRDLDEIRSFLDGVATGLARRTALDLQRGLRSVAENPQLGTRHSLLTRLLGVEVRSRSVPPYRIFYCLSQPHPEVISILHGARDISSVLSERFQ